MSTHTYKTFLIRGVISLITLFFISPYYAFALSDSDIFLEDNYNSLIDSKEVTETFLDESLKYSSEDYVLYSYKKNISFKNILNSTTEKIGDDLKIYFSDRFYKEGEDWYNIDWATSTIESFNTLIEQKSLEENLLSFKIYPVNAGTIYTDSGDGYVQYDVSSGTWTQAVDYSTGSSVNYTGTSLRSDLYSTGARHIINRSFISLDVSIPDGYEIESGYFSLVPHTVQDNEGDAYGYTGIYQASQAGTSTLVTADYDNVQDTILTNKVDTSDISAGSAAIFTLTETGLATIATGTNKFSLREGHDVEYSQPDNSGVWIGVYWRASEYTGTADDPFLYLSLTETQQQSQTFEESELPEFLPVINDLSMITGVIYTMASGSTTTIESMQKVYYHIPFLVWLVFWLIFAFIFGRILLEFIIILRQKNGR